jgi:glycosyltransferase involved in cell wall biosynthesis
MSIQNVKKNTGLNIAMIGHKRIPSREGGIEVVVEELATRMVERGNNVTAYNRRGHHVSGRKLDAKACEKLTLYKGIKIVKVITFNIKGLAAVTSAFFGTIRALFKHYDVIHYHAEGPCMMIMLPHIFGIRTVATIHGLDWQRGKWGGAASKIIKWGEKVAARYADEIIVLSKNLQKYFLDVYGRRTTYITNGISKPVLRMAHIIHNVWGLEKDSYFLFLGRIVPEKGINYLIDAFTNLQTTKKLVIAGGASDTGGYMNEMKKKASADCRIIFTDFVQGQVLEELYSNAYAYVLPSDVEGMPISLLEAMSYGNCCVVSDIPECAEVVEDRAVLFKKGDAADLLNKLTVLIRNPAVVQAYRRDVTEFVCRKYDWDTIVCQTMSLYQAEERRL